MKHVCCLFIALILFPHMASAKSFADKHRTVINAIIKAADIAEVPRELLLSVCFSESSFRTRGMTQLDGDTLSHGLCQIKLATARDMDVIYKHKHKVTVEKLETPFYNAFYAAKYLKHHLYDYDDQWKLAVDAYNHGHAVSAESDYVKLVCRSLDFIRKHIKQELLYASGHSKALQ